jgi:hypothetical protein
MVTSAYLTARRTNQAHREDEKGGLVPDLAIEDAGDVIDAGADVTEDDGPGQGPDELAGCCDRTAGRGCEVGTGG